MTIEALLACLDGVRRSGRGWMARCPAHDDRKPSLSVREGDDSRILVHCFAGCLVGDICAALGLAMRNLFPASEPLPRSQREVHPKPWRFDWRRTAADFQFRTDSLWLRAQSVRQAARRLDTSEWTGEDFDAAINAVGKAYTDLEWADVLEDVAFKLRGRGLNKERQQSEARSTAA